jgi:hypothetical protein
LPCYKGIFTIVAGKIAIKMHRMGKKKGRRMQLFTCTCNKQGV